jgi:hypothetical protein
MSTLPLTNSDIAICSNALLLLAHPSINSFDEVGAGPTLCKALYPNTYRLFIAESNWNFATKIQQLSMLSTAPIDTNFKYQYQLPTDMCRINSTIPISNYSIIGDKLFSNDENLFIEYQSYVDEINLPPYAIEALQLLMASKLAYPLTNDGKKTELYANLYTDALRKARFIDSQNDVNSGFSSNVLTDVRN